jgi:hypothetical protein
LHPANITMNACRGYNVSSSIYGDYGIGLWPQRNACYPPGTIFAPGRHGTALTIPSSSGSSSPAPTPVTAPGGGNLLARNSLLISAVDSTAAAQEAADVAKLAAMAEKALGHPLEPETLKLLLNAQSLMRQEQAALVRLFDAGEINADEYLARLTALTRAGMENNFAILGEARFLAIFGEAGLHPEGLVDRDVFLATARRA